MNPLVQMGPEAAKSAASIWQAGRAASRTDSSLRKESANFNCSSPYLKYLLLAHCHTQFVPQASQPDWREAGCAAGAGPLLQSAQSASQRVARAARSQGKRRRPLFSSPAAARRTGVVTSTPPPKRRGVAGGAGSMRLGEEGCCPGYLAACPAMPDWTF